MKKLTLWVVALLAGLVAQAEVWWTSNPASAVTGSSYSISAEANGGWGLTTLEIYKNGSLFAYGEGSIWAAAGDTTTDYGTTTLYYTADAYFNNWGYGETIYHSIVITQPNTPPTIEWSLNPGSATVNQWFNIEAHGSDADGNLAQVNVWRDGVPHALGGGGDGSNGWSGNGYAQGSAGAVTFSAQAMDSYGVYSDIIYHTVYITENNGIAYNYTNWPATAYMNQAVGFYINITNSGSKYWGASHYLSMRDWNDSDIYYPWLNGWSPGTTGNANFSFTTPNAPGVYPYHFQALEHMVEWFGPQFSMSVEVVNRQPVSPTISSGCASYLIPDIFSR
jgi:hypothetical protein